MLLIDVVPMIVAGLILFFTSGAASTPCPSNQVAVSVTSAADVQNLTDVLSCTGGGEFNVTWYRSMAIGRTIEVSDKKNVTVTGIDMPSIRGTLADTKVDDTFVDGGSGSGIFTVWNRSTLRLNHLVLEGGSAVRRGAVNLRSGSFFFAIDCIFRNNNASYGGAIFASNSAIYHDGNTSFVDNSALFGGGIYAEKSDVHVDGNIAFRNNSAKGAIDHNPAVLVTTNTSAEFSFTLASPVTSSGDGDGAIYSDASEVYMCCNTSLARNFAEYQGGAIYANKSAIYIDGNTYVGNNYVDGATSTTYTTLHSSSSSSSSAEDFASGGGIYVELSVLGIDGNTVYTNNSATLDGGAVHAHTSTVTMYGNTEASGNTCGLRGGAIKLILFSEISIYGNATFTNNWTGKDGAAMHARESNFYFRGNIEFSLNYAVGKGGAVKLTANGLVAESWSHLIISGNEIFTNNTAGLEGGALFLFASRLNIDGSAIFTNNTCGADGGSFRGLRSNITIAGRKSHAGELSGTEGGWYEQAGGDYTVYWSVAFIGNSAVGIGGAMHVDECEELEARNVMFRSNEASLGGAMYVAAVENKQTSFIGCVFEGNEAADGGGVYLYTGPGVDVFTASVFKNNFAITSGGAVFHTGAMRAFDTSFVANEAGVEGPAIMSLGLLEELSNVSFSANTLYCPAGEYGYIINHEDDFCSSCFDEVCSRCSSGGDATTTREHVRISGLPVCEEPPRGSTARPSGTTVETLTLQQGFFRTSDMSRDILKCYGKNACDGGNNADNYCASGYTGPYCAVCAEGFSPGIGYRCRQCSGSITVSALVLTVAVCLAVLILAAFHILRLGGVKHDRAMEDKKTTWKQKLWSWGAFLADILPLTAIKIVVTVWQIISQFDAIAGDVYPTLYQNFVSKINPLNLELDFILSYSCFVTNDFYDRLIFATITPFVVLIVLTGSYFIAKKKNSLSESAVREVRFKHQAAVLCVAFLVYSPVSYKIFQTFSCDKLNDEETYLPADYSLSCMTSRHSWYVAYALIMVCVYPIGIAAAFAWLLLWNRRDLDKPDRETLAHLQPLNGMWAPYKPSRYYYEVVECCRRIALTAVAAFVLPNSTAQISIALMIAVVFVFISETLSPFEKGADMGLYRWGNGIIVASMYVAFLMKINVRKERSYAMLTFSGVLILANVFMVVAVLLQTLILVKQFRRKKNSIKVIGPVRRTNSAFVTGDNTLNELDVIKEEDIAVESKRSDI